MINNQDEAEAVLTHTESRYDIYFKVIGKSIFDIFELTLYPKPTLMVKEELNIPKPMLTELDKHFTIINQQ
jgi:hypothetical protein